MDIITGAVLGLLFLAGYGVTLRFLSSIFGEEKE